MLGVHLNENRMTRYMEAEKKKIMNMRILNLEWEEAMSCVRTKKTLS